MKIRFELFQWYLIAFLMQFNSNTLKGAANISKYFSDSTETEVLDEIDIHQVVALGSKVSLRKSGLNILLITQEMIQKLPVQNINELLSHVAGVDIRQRGIGGSQADIGIRGSSFDQVLVLVDGVRMSDPQTGHHQMNLPIPLNAIKYIEVIKGGAAHKYGLNALAGVVNIVTILSQANAGNFQSSDNVNEKSGLAEGQLKGNRNRLHNQHKGEAIKRFKQPQMEVDVFTGAKLGALKNTDGSKSTDSVFYRQFGARFFLMGSRGNWSYWVGSEIQQGNGFRLNSDYLNFRNTAGLSYNRGIHHVYILGGAVNNAFGASYFYAAPRDTFAREEVNTQFVQGRYRLEVGGKGEFELQISSRWNYDHYVFRNYNPEYYQNFHSTRVDMQRLQYTHKVLKHARLGFGVDLRQEMIRSTNLGDPNANLQRNRRFSGGYMHYSQDFFKRLSLNTGVYLLSSPDLKTRIYPGIELNYRVVDGLNLYGNYGLGQRLPTFTDLYYNDLLNQSNPNLKPEFSESFEAGVKIAGGGYYWGLSFFQRNVFQMIDWLRPDINAKWMPVNQSSVQFRGLEAQVNWMNAFWIKGLQFGWGFCLLEGNLKLDSGYISKNALSYLGDHTTFRMSYEVNSKITMGCTYRYFERFNSPWSNNNSENPGYGIWDVKVKYQVNKRFSGYLNGMNIGNTQYREIFSVPMAPRWIQIGLIVGL